MKHIIVVVEGGGVTMIENIPQGVMIEVQDYDTDDTLDQTRSRMIKDKDGDWYEPTLFTAKQKIKPTPEEYAAGNFAAGTEKKPTTIKERFDEAAGLTDEKS